MDPKISGSWALVGFKLVATDGSGELHPFGENPDGMITYTSDGYMSTVLHARDRTAFSTDDIQSGTEQELAEAMRSYSHYAGRYETENGIVRHIVEHSLFPNWAGHTEERKYTIVQDILTLVTPPFFIAGAEHIGKVTFKRRY